MTDSLNDARLNLEAAKARLQAATQAYSDASRERTAAVNAMNTAQAEFDKTVLDVRKAASLPGSDWGRQRNPGLPV